MPEKYCDPCVLYSIELDGVFLHNRKGATLGIPDATSNGRASYIVFEALIRHLTGLERASGSDHQDSQGRKYEQKAFKDCALYPTDRADLFQTSASSTFPANNHGPTIQRWLDQGKYDDALRLCSETGYAKNDFYIYTNTAQWVNRTPLQYIVVPTATVLDLLSPDDPRLISRRSILELATSTVDITTF